MAVDLIRYDLLVQDALRGTIRQVLLGAARDGLPGDHHFYISFRTQARGVRLSSRMRELYPDEMTIILQHQFWDLSVGEESFEVGLSFRNVPEMLQIPFNAITCFFDPSIGFELKFMVEDEAAEGRTEPFGTLQPQSRPEGGPAGPPPALSPEAPEANSDKDQQTPSGAAAAGTEEKDARATEPKVVSIDAFRKKS